jgi:hypothetical protein
MSATNTQQMLKCSQCGDYYVLASLQTTFSDPDGAMLIQFMKDLEKNGMCPACVERKNYADSHKSDFIARPLIYLPGAETVPQNQAYWNKVEEKKRENIRRRQWERRRHYDRNR